MATNSINILLVDDCRDYSTIMKFWLMSRGHKVTDVSNGKEALEVIRGEIPHIIFLDINMPEMDGVETLRHIRGINREVPVILVTAGGSREQIEEAQSLGVSGIFNKSDDFLEAAKMIQETLTNLSEDFP